MGKTVLLNSGGMDSFFVAIESRPDIHVFVDIGQKYMSKEYKSSRRIASFVGAEWVYVPGAQIAQFEHPSGIIPLRNAELLLCAGQYGEEIYLGILEGEVNSDKSPEFLRAMEAVMNISCREQYWSDGREYSIHTPLGTRSKVDLLRGLKDRPTAWDEALQTVSCYSSSSRHCGTCASCFKRWVALTVASGQDYHTYFTEHPAKRFGLEYWESKGYDEKRINEIREAYDLVRG